MSWTILAFVITLLGVALAFYDLTVGRGFPDSCLSPFLFGWMSSAAAIAAAGLIGTPFSRWATVCGLLRALRFLAAGARFDGVAAAIGLFDLLWAHETLFVEMNRSYPEKAWIAGVGKAVLVCDINTRLLLLFGVTSCLGPVGHCWSLFVLSTYVLSVFLLARSSPAYCGVIVACLAGIAGRRPDQLVQATAAICAAVAAAGFVVVTWKDRMAQRGL